MAGNSTCYVYILWMSNRKHYTGLTNSIIRRMEQHDKGYSKSTKWYRPVKLIWVTEVLDRKTARRLEVRIKNRGAKLFLLDQRFRPNRIHKNVLHNI